MFRAKKLCFGLSHPNKQVLNVDQVIIEDVFCHIEQPEDCRISHRIEDVLSFLPADDKIAASHNRQLLGKRALLDLQLRAEFINANFPCAERVKDGDSQRMRKGFKEFSFESR